MTRVVAFLVVIAVVTCPTAGAPVPAGLDGPAYYYPTRVGDRMTFQSPRGEVEHVVTDVEKKGETRVVTVWKTDENGRYAPLMTLEVSGQGLVLVRQGSDHRLEDFGPFPLLRLPLVVGQKWDAPFSPTRMASLVSGKEEVVKVPAGVFRAIPVERHLPGKAQPPSFRVWFARGVGQVKAEAPGEAPQVLKSFTAAKD